MLRYLKPKENASSSNEDVSALLAAAHEKLKTPKPKRKRNKEWMKWEEVKKAAVVAAYKQGGLAAVRLHHGDVPGSTVRGWKSQILENKG